MVWALLSVTSTSVTQKDDLMCGTKHSPMATLERLLCCIHSFHTSLRLPNLITRGETPRPWVSYALCQGLVVFLSFYLWLKTRAFHLLFSCCWDPREENHSEWPCCSTLRHPETHSSRTPEQTYSQLDVQTSHVWFYFAATSWRPQILSDPCCAILLHKAKKITKRELSMQTPDSIGAKLLITSALRAYRNRHLRTLMRCCEAWKPIEDCFDALSFECVDFQQLCQIFASLTRQKPWNTWNWGLNPPLDANRKDIALARCRNGQRAWRKKKPVLSLSAVTDEEPSVENEDESGRKLCEYWWTIFQAREEGTRHHQHDFLRFVQQAPDDISWTIDQAEFDELLALKKDSALGPDGIPYGAGGLGSKFLFRADRATLEGRNISDNLLKVGHFLSLLLLILITLEG